MKVGALLSQSLGSIWGNKARSGLTILGIVIGIAAVIALVGLGKGLQSTVTSRIGGLGTTKITIRSQDPNRPTAQREGGGPGGPGGARGGFSFGATSTESLTGADYALIKTTANITQASPEERGQIDVTTSSDATTATGYQLYGVDTDYLLLQSLAVKDGVAITKDQVANGDRVVLVGEGAAKELFGSSAAAIGKTLYVKGNPMVIVGTIKGPDNATPFNDPTSNMYTGYKTWLTINNKTKLSNVVANASSESTVDAAAASVEAAILKNHGVTDSTKADVAVSTSKDLLKTASNVASSFTTTLAGIAGISLIVGGIGIMNIMLVTVTERTREIGLRRAVGAKNRHILLQFLIEAVLLTVIGGVIGLLLGVVVSQHVGSLINVVPGRRGGAGTGSVKAVVDVGTMLLAVGISALIGVVFGLFPAIKAARLDPVEALRYE